MAETKKIQTRLPMALYRTLAHRCADLDISEPKAIALAVEQWLERGSTESHEIGKNPPVSQKSASIELIQHEPRGEDAGQAAAGSLSGLRATDSHLLQIESQVESLAGEFRSLSKQLTEITESLKGIAPPGGPGTRKMQTRSRQRG